MRDLRLSPRNRWELRSSGLLNMLRNDPEERSSHQHSLIRRTNLPPPQKNNKRI